MRWGSGPYLRFSSSPSRTEFFSARALTEVWYSSGREGGGLGLDSMRCFRRSSVPPADDVEGAGAVRESGWQRLSSLRHWKRGPILRTDG
jgi:hypothetical protein